MEIRRPKTKQNKKKIYKTSSSKSKPEKEKGAILTWQAFSSTARGFFAIGPDVVSAIFLFLFFSWTPPFLEPGEAFGVIFN